MTEIMTKEEIHDFGIEVVFNQLKKDGYKIKDVDTNIKNIPSIIATKDDTLIFVEVRTDVFPKKGELENQTHNLMIEHSKKQNAIPYFASVGIANAEADNEEEMSIPKKGGGFHIAYEGLQIVETE